MQPMSARSSMPGIGAAASPNTISGSMRGSAKPCKETSPPAFRQVADRAVVHISPHRRVNVVFGPNCPVGETDLASDRALSPGLALRSNRSSDPVGLLQSEIGAPRGEGLNLPAGPQGGEGLLRDLLNVHLFGLQTAGATGFKARFDPSGGFARVSSRRDDRRCVDRNVRERHCRRGKRGNFVGLLSR